MTQTSVFSLDFAAATDIGCQRSNNEDSFGYDADRHVYVVCDGMGGSAAGEIASGMAVRALIETFEAQAQGGNGDGEIVPRSRARLLNSVHAANRVVREAADANPRLYGMGSTLVCACLDGTRVVIGNVGDSRAYLIRNGIQLMQGYAGPFAAGWRQQMRMGLLTPEEAAVSNLQSVITRAIGATDAVEPDFCCFVKSGRYKLLLASDGLTRYALPEEIASMALAGD